MASSEDTITGLLDELSQGKPHALDRLIPVVYDELRTIAHAQLRGERPGHTLNTTGLVHEAFLRLIELREIEWRDRSHFFAMAARLMRRVLIDYAKARNRAKRSGRAADVPLHDAMHVAADSSDSTHESLLDLEEALVRLEARDDRLCRVVECRCLAGLSIEETAAALDVSTATVKRDWAIARALLNRDLAATVAGRKASGAAT